MKNKILIKAVRYTMVFVALVFFTRCLEEVKQPCDELDDISINFKTSRIAVCGDKSETEIIKNVEIFVFQKVLSNNTLDTLTHSYSNDKGELQATFPNSSCGLSNLFIKAYYNGIEIYDSIDFMCCTRDYLLDFVEKCDEAKKIVLDCDSSNKNLEVNIKGQTGSCVLLGTPDSGLRYNRLLLESKEQITIDFNQLLALKPPFSVQFSTAPGPDGKITLGASVSSVELIFLVDSKATGIYNQLVTLPVVCNYGEGNTDNVDMQISVKADVCDDDCACPFDSEYNMDESSFGVLVGETHQFSSFNIPISESMLSNNCYLNVVAVRRFNSTASISSIPSGESNRFDWTLKPITLPIKLTQGSVFEIEPIFQPISSGLSVDTFEVEVDVYNLLDFKKETCTFNVITTGLGCENICPELILNNSLPAQLSTQSNAVIGNLKKGDIVTMDQGTRIQQSAQGFMGSLCGLGESSNMNMAYRVTVPDVSGAITCSNVNLEFIFADDGTTGDRSFFSATKSFTSLAMGQTGDFVIEFKTPTMAQYLASGHDSIYRSLLTVRAVDLMGRLICEQQIRLAAKVNESSIQLSTPMLMKAFSQVSDVEPLPSYMAYKVNYYNTLYKYYGKIDNLHPANGNVNTFTIPPTPQTDHTFYFEVDDPKNTTLLQKPKLYLVDENLNSYNMVSAHPIAKYKSNSAFMNDLENLVGDVFKNGNFQSRGEAPYYSFNFSTSTSTVMWTPSLSASQVKTNKGIDIQLGEVYVIWNPKGSKEVNQNLGGKYYSSYCEVAFLYIDGISDGSGTNHHIANVSFYVAYPLSIIKE